MAGKILIVDDEEALRFFTADSLARAGWYVNEADSGEAALTMLTETVYDVILLDLRMVGIDGITVMRRVKEQWPETIIIIMTAYASVDSAIESVRQGAFDYLQKPCTVNDIIACVNRALAKKQTLEPSDHTDLQAKTWPPALPANDVIRSGQLVIEPGAHAVTWAGQPVSLTPTEYALLALLAESLGQSISLERLIQEGLGYDSHDSQAQETLRVHISRLRRKLDPAYIMTVRGGGYALAKLPPLG
jgi:two-component system, OmpR family, response regulator